MNLQPVFIIGAGRSGTKFLRDTLAASPDVIRVPYDIGYIWRYGNEGLAHDEVDSWSVSDKSINWIRRKLPRLVDRDVDKPNATVLVEKSVPNSLRPLLLYRAFPEATFIHLVRDGRAVTESAIRMWQTPPDKGYLVDKIRYFPWSNVRYGIWYIWNRVSGIFKTSPPIWGPRYKGIEVDIRKDPLHVVCAKQWFHCVDVAFRQLSVVPDDQVITVRYEEIMQGGDVMESLCERLGIDPQPVVNYHLANLRPGENDKWRDSLTLEQQKDINAVFEELPPLVKEFIFREKTV